MERSIVAALAAVALVSGCEASDQASGVDTSRTAGQVQTQAKDEAADAVTQIVSATDLRVLKAVVGLTPCGEGDGAPQRGTAVIHYPASATSRDIPAANLAIVEKLTGAGWIPDPYPHDLTPDLHKDGVDVVIRARGPGADSSVLWVLGECHDATDVAGQGAPLDPTPAR